MFGDVNSLEGDAVTRDELHAGSLKGAAVERNTERAVTNKTQKRAIQCIFASSHTVYCAFPLGNLAKSRILGYGGRFSFARANPGRAPFVRHSLGDIRRLVSAAPVQCTT